VFLDNPTLVQVRQVHAAVLRSGRTPKILLQAREGWG